MTTASPVGPMGSGHECGNCGHRIEFDWRRGWIHDGTGYSECADAAAVAHADQISARLRRNHETTNTGSVRLNRNEMEALINSGAGQEEVMAWLQAQIDRAIAEQATLTDLEDD
jgi:hypothetical protein